MDLDPQDRQTLCAALSAGIQKETDALRQLSKTPSSVAGAQQARVERERLLQKYEALRSKLTDPPK
jgi:hypothetical protein